MRSRLYSTTDVWYIEVESRRGIMFSSLGAMRYLRISAVDTGKKADIGDQPTATERGYVD